MAKGVSAWLVAVVALTLFARTSWQKVGGRLYHPVDVIGGTDMGNPMAMHTPSEMEEILLEDMEERGMSEDEIEAYIHEEEDKYDQQMGTNIRAERHQKKEKQKRVVARRSDKVKPDIGEGGEL